MDSPLSLLNNEQREIIQILENIESKFESPSKDDFEKVTGFSSGESEEDEKKRIQHVTEVICLTVQLITDYAKKIPFFDTLKKEDQTTLLKQNYIAIMLLRLARGYNRETDSIAFAYYRTYTRDNLDDAGMKGLSTFIFQFCVTMHNEKVSKAEYALLIPIVIFSDQHSLLEPGKVRNLQEFYIECLRALIGTSYTAGNNYCNQLLSILNSLRNCCNKEFEKWLTQKVYDDLPPLLKDMLGIHK